MKVDPDRWEEIGRRANAASEGPWMVGESGAVGNISTAWLVAPSIKWMDRIMPTPADAAFIANARTDVPDLLDDLHDARQNLIMATQERERFRVHSMKLNEIGWLMAEALGYVKPGQPLEDADIDMLVRQLIERAKRP